MSLRDIANNALEGFDATKDSPNAFEGLPSGDYIVTLQNVEHRVTQSGFEGLNIVVEVTEGEHTGQKDFNMFNFDSTTANGNTVPDSVIAGHIKLVAKLAAAVGVTLNDEDWDSIDTLSVAFMEAKGKMLNMHLDVRENKKRPEYPYKNYDFSKLSEDQQPQELEIKDDDLPF